MADDALLKIYQKGSLWFSAILVVPLTAFLIYSAAYWADPTEFQRQVVRFIAAVDAGLLAVFLVGGILLRWKAWGLSISAGAGFALFVLMMFVPQTNPFPPPARVSGQPTFRGDSLGTLLEILEEKYAAGEIQTKVSVDAGQRDQISNFGLGAAEWTGKTWVELIQRICNVHTCLRCTAAGVEAVSLGVSGKIEKQCQDEACVEYRYRCVP